MVGARRDQERWFEVKRQSLRERVTDWLEEEELNATIEFELEPARCIRWMRIATS